jgi:transposase-like protein
VARQYKGEGIMRGHHSLLDVTAAATATAITTAITCITATATMEAKRGVKRKTTTLETKYKAILEVEEKVLPKGEIAKKYGVPSNTLSTWLSKAEEYKKAYETQEFGPNVLLKIECSFAFFT